MSRIQLLFVCSKLCNYVQLFPNVKYYIIESYNMSFYNCLKYYNLAILNL